MPLLVTANHAQATLRGLKHYYGACGPEMVHYAAMARGCNDHAVLILLCERRLENVIRRAGLASARWNARRAVVHGHIFVNGRKMTHPGYLIQAGDVVAVRPRPGIQALYCRSLAAATQAPQWLRVEPAELRIVVTRLPAADDVDLPVNTKGVIELLAHGRALTASEA